MARVLLDYSTARALKTNASMDVSPSKSSSRSEIEVVSFSDPDSDECNENRWQSRQFNEKRRACFICEKSDDFEDCEEILQQTQSAAPPATVGNVHDDEHTADDDDDTFGHNKIRKCSFPSCNIRFHENCFLAFNEGDFLPRMHILDKVGDPCIDLKLSKRWFCPQHECNFCHQELLRTRAFQGKFIRCVMCVFAWHRSCVIVGSQHINRKYDRYVLCPRHNNLKRVSKRNVPYCIKCEELFENEAEKVACSSCIRSFCRSCVAEKKQVEKTEAESSLYVCDFCRCVDFPRIGDYVLAAYKSCFWPAKTLHADLLPQSLYSKHSLVKKLEEPGYVLVQWIEGLVVPNYDVITCRDLIPFPKTIKCPFWKRMKTRGNIHEAVKAVYNDREAAVGIKRPMPPEVKAEGVPKYTRIKANINMRLAKARTGITELSECNCEPISGERCTVAHGCLNRLMMTECPENCDAIYFEKRRSYGGTKRQVLKRTAEMCGNIELPSQKMCRNNFLRHHDTNDDELLLEEKPTEMKGFGVFAKCDISEGTDLTEYMGRVMTKVEYFEKLQFRGLFNDLEMSYFGMQLTNDFYVDARNCGSIARSFNHSCEPNCKVDAVTVDGIYRLKVSTIKNVKKGEELTYDYDTEISDGLVGMECFCGSANCRRIIGKKAITVRKCSNVKTPLVEQTNDVNVGNDYLRRATDHTSEGHVKRKRTRSADEKKRPKKSSELSVASRPSSHDTVFKVRRSQHTTLNKENLIKKGSGKHPSAAVTDRSVQTSGRPSRNLLLSDEEDRDKQLIMADATQIREDRNRRRRMPRRMPEIHH